MVRFFFLMLVVSGSAQAAVKPVTLCLKAYSNAENQKQWQGCPALSNALNDLGSSALSFRTQCVNGPRVFNELGCAVYDVALTGEMTAPDNSDPIVINKCLKAYSTSETLRAKAVCDRLATSLNQADLASFRFDLSCVTGRDTFFKYGCGVYDAAMVGEFKPR